MAFAHERRFHRKDAKNAKNAKSYKENFEKTELNLPVGAGLPAKTTIYSQQIRGQARSYR